MTLTIGVFAAAVPFFTMQMRALAQDVGRTDAQQTARYAQNTVDRELRNIGIGVQPMDASQGIPRNQPKIVQAHAYSVTFNTDLIANDTADVEAVYFDPNVPLNMTVAMTTGATVSLPYSSKSYPDYTYRKSDASLSLAETVSYWVSPDSSATGSNMYVLWRRVNDGAISVVATGIRIASGQPFFKYNRVLPSGAIDSIATSALPDLLGPVREHRRLHSYGHAHGERRVSGVQPAEPGTDLRADRQLADGAGQHRAFAAQLLRRRAAQSGRAHGDDDLQRRRAGSRADDVHGIARRDVGGEGHRTVRDLPPRGRDTPWAEPISQVGKSNSATYTWEDFNLVTGVTFEYGVSAQDCSPANSAMRVSSPITH